MPIQNLLYLTIDELRQRQDLDLEQKVKLTKAAIRQFYEFFDGQVYISFSGGGMIQNPMLMVSRFAPLFSSKDQTWRTPQGIYDLLDAEFHFEFDPCPPNPQFDGLTIEWKDRNFINPPYKDTLVCIKKGYEESLKGKLCVFLVASRTDTRWFQDYCLPYAKEIRFIKGRLRFGESKNSAPFPSAVIIFDGRKQP